MRSITKSVVSLLYGIALDRGLVPTPDASLLDQFPDHADLVSDAQRAAQRISHVLTMTLGTDWNEDIPYTDPANSEIMMEQAKDRIRFILERPMIGAPGSRWTYSGGCAALIGALIAKGTGLPLAEFARQTLFEPLGISHVEWAAGEDGSHSAASGLRLRPRDLLRIGEMILGNGEWGGQRIVSAGWLQDSFRPAISTGDGIDYGRLWWLGEAPVPALGGPQNWIGGFGNGGQRLWMMPATGIAMVVMSGNYNKPDAWVWPTRIWREIVLANLKQL
jgi:CubicO group peptidase (beta-lactamase class C family)